SVRLPPRVSTRSRNPRGRNPGRWCRPGPWPHRRPAPVSARRRAYAFVTSRRIRGFDGDGTKNVPRAYVRTHTDERRTRRPCDRNTSSSEVPTGGATPVLPG